MTPTDTAGNLGDDVDNYDWNEDAFKPSQEATSQTSQSRQVSPKTFKGTW